MKEGNFTRCSFIANEHVSGVNYRLTESGRIIPGSQSTFSEQKDGGITLFPYAGAEYAKEQCEAYRQVYLLSQKVMTE